MIEWSQSFHCPIPCLTPSFPRFQPIVLPSHPINFRHITSSMRYINHSASVPPRSIHLTLLNHLPPHPCPSPSLLSQTPSFLRHTPTLPCHTPFLAGRAPVTAFIIPFIGVSFLNSGSASVTIHHLGGDSPPISR